MRAFSITARRVRERARIAGGLESVPLPRHTRVDKRPTIYQIYRMTLLKDSMARSISSLGRALFGKAAWFAMPEWPGSGVSVNQGYAGIHQ